jgi:hypothetical protein
MFDTEALYIFKKEYMRALNIASNTAELWT